MYLVISPAASAALNRDPQANQLAVSVLRKYGADRYSAIDPQARRAALLTDATAIVGAASRGEFDRAVDSGVRTMAVCSSQDRRAAVVRAAVVLADMMVDGRRPMKVLGWSDRGAKMTPRLAAAAAGSVAPVGFVVTADGQLGCAP